MSYNDIMKLPYITFVLGMADAPQVDYDINTDKKERKQKLGFGTPLSKLSKDIIAQMR